jgi:predicted PurR-regulated permease PerM
MQKPHTTTTSQSTTQQQTLEPQKPTELASNPEVSVSMAAQWTIRHMIVGTWTVLGIVLLFLLLYRFYMVVFLFFVAFSLTVAIEPAVAWLARYKIRREIGILLIYALLFALTGLLIWFLAPTLISQGRKVMADLPGYYSDVRTYLLEMPSGLVRGLARTLPQQLSIPTLLASVGDGESADGSATWNYIWLGARTLVAFLAVFAMAYYWTLEGDLILRKLILQAPAQRRDEVRNLITEINGKIGSYFRGQVILCVIVGALSVLAFFAIGIPNSLVLGLLMGIFEAIPVLGPTLGAIPAILMTLATSPEMTIWVVVALVAIQVLENNLLVPRVMDQSVGVNAVVSMLAITAFGVLFGIGGAILAIPLAAILQILLNRVLFQTSASEETASGLPTTVGVSRSQWGVLRLEARDLAQAVRKRARDDTDPDPTATDSEETADEIEAIAVEIDHWLSEKEATA